MPNGLPCDTPAASSVGSRQASTPPPADWQGEYEEFLSGNWEERQHRKRRIANAVSFLQKNRDAPLVKRMEFLSFKGLSEVEMEEAFEVAGQNQDLIRIMEQSFVPSDYGPTAEEIALAKANQLHTPFRVEDEVWVYDNLQAVYLKGVVCDIDESRTMDDILCVRFAEADTGSEEWKAPGFKSVVADAEPDPDRLRIPNCPILCRKETGRGLLDGIVVQVNEDTCTCDIETSTCELRKAVPWLQLRTVAHPSEPLTEVEINPEEPETDETVGLVVSAYGFPQQGARERGAQARELLALMKGEENARGVETVGQHEDGNLDGEADDLTVEERSTFGANLRSFLRYPYLDLHQRLPKMQTYSDFCQSYAGLAITDTAPSPTESEIRRDVLRLVHDDETGMTEAVDEHMSPPVTPTDANAMALYMAEVTIPDAADITGHASLDEKPSGVGYGFDLSGLAHHPTCPYLLEYNPILEIAWQCRRTDTMFVDPDFPPTDMHIWGPEGPPHPIKDEDMDEGEPEPEPEKYEWRRLSEIHPVPRGFMTGSNLNKMKPGPFTPQWMCAVFSNAYCSLEFETLFSPSQEPSYCGAYTVKLHVDGKFWYVVVDDFVPIYKNHKTLACVRSSVDHEIWPCLLEKVYAKLQRSYHEMSISRTFGPEVVYEDLSTGLAQRDCYRLLTNKNTWFGNMQGRHENQQICTMLAVAPRKTTVSVERKMSRLGIEVGGYHVVQHLLVSMDEKGQQDESSNFVMTSDPWSIVDPEESAQLTTLRACRAHTLRELQKIAHAYTDKTGVACTWLPFAEHMRLFDACITTYSFKNYQRALVKSSFEGRSGGSRFTYDNDQWTNNPQVYISITAKADFAAELCLTDKRFRDDPDGKVDGKVLQLSLLKAPGYNMRAADTSGTILTSNQLLFEDAATIDFYSVYLRCSIDPGGYLLVPEIGTYNSKEAFVLKIWSSAEFSSFLIEE